MTRNCLNVMRKVAAEKRIPVPKRPGYVPGNPVNNFMNNLSWAYQNPERVYGDLARAHTMDTDTAIGGINRVGDYLSKNVVPFIDRHGSHIANRHIPAYMRAANALNRNNARAMEAVTSAGNQAMDTYVPQAVNKLKSYGNAIVNNALDGIDIDSVARAERAAAGGLKRLGGRIYNYFNNL